MSEKQANYTTAMVERLHEAYDPQSSEETREEAIATLSEEFGKTVKSVRAKLVREGLYVKKAYVSKAGKRPETKEAIVQSIAAAVGVDADSQLSGLEKATKNCLTFLRDRLTA